MKTLTEAELFAAYVPQESELLRAYKAAKTLAEQLELIDMPFEYQVVREVRGRIRERLDALPTTGDK